MYVEVIHRWFGWTSAVQAQTQTFVAERVDGAGEKVSVRIPDQVLFNTEMEAGFPVQYVVSAVIHHGQDLIEVYGSNATLRYEVDAEALTIAEAGDKQARPVDILPEDAYNLENWRVEQDFVDAIREGKEYHPSFEDGRRYMQVVQAVYDSAEQGRTVALA